MAPAAALLLEAESRVGVPGAAAPPGWEVRPVLPGTEWRGEPLCGGVLTPASAAATAAAGVMFPALPQSPPELPHLPSCAPPLLLRPSRVGVLAVGADRMLSMKEVTSGGAGERTVRGLPIAPPTPLLDCALTGDSAGLCEPRLLSRVAPLAHGLA